MPEETVQVETLGRIVAAEAEYQDISTDALNVWVSEGAYCSAPAGTPADEVLAWGDRWIAPPESHENFAQHRWDELTAMYANKHCAPCPVKQACLALAERLPQSYSGLIRGGLTPKDRRLEPAPESESVPVGALTLVTCGICGGSHYASTCTTRNGGGSR